MEDALAHLPTSNRGTLRQLRVLAVLLPISFLLLLEVARWLFVEPRRNLGATHLTLGIVEIVAVIAFSTAMFDLLERTHRQNAQRNRELGAANAISTALREPHDVDGMVDAALAAILAATGALVATIVVHSRESRWATSGIASGRINPDLTPAADEPRQVVDIPLTTGTATLGTLRLTFLVGGGREPLLSRDTFLNIGQQLAATMQNVALIEDLRRGMAEGHAFYDILIRISNDNRLPETLTAVVNHALVRTDAAAAVLRLNERTTQLLQSDGEFGGPGTLPMQSACFCSSGDHNWHSHTGDPACALRDDPRYVTHVTVPLRGPEGVLGDLWLARAQDRPFEQGETRFLATLSELISIAITNARLQGKERQAATVAERERIAREMHDSTAQVLAVAQLRLRALDSNLDRFAVTDIRSEVVAVADMCHDAYADVREAIMALREFTRGQESLLDALRSYVGKYSRQSGVHTTLVSAVDGELLISPQAELQLLRVVQEALTNVRKHSGAQQAKVTVRPAGDELEFEVSDDGHGFSMIDVGSGGVGLHSMRERLALVGGTLQVESAPGMGTRVIARVTGSVADSVGRPEVISVVG